MEAKGTDGTTSSGEGSPEKHTWAWGAHATRLRFPPPPRPHSTTHRTTFGLGRLTPRPREGGPRACSYRPKPTAIGRRHPAGESAMPELRGDPTLAPAEEAARRFPSPARGGVARPPSADTTRVRGKRRSDGASASPAARPGPAPPPPFRLTSPRRRLRPAPCRRRGYCCGRYLRGVRGGSATVPATPFPVPPRLPPSEYINPAPKVVASPNPGRVEKRAGSRRRLPAGSAGA